MRGISESKFNQDYNKIHQMALNYRVIKLKILNQLSPLWWKIFNESKIGTRFLMEFPFKPFLKCLISFYHIISNDSIDKYIKIEIHNEKK